MSDNKVSVQVGPGFAGCLTLVFITLKLCGIIEWSWIWVLCPLWLGLAIFLSIVVVVALVAAIVTALK